MAKRLVEDLFGGEPEAGNYNCWLLTTENDETGEMQRRPYGSLQEAHRAAHILLGGNVDLYNHLVNAGYVRVGTMVHRVRRGRF